MKFSINPDKIRNVLNKAFDLLLLICFIVVVSSFVTKCTYDQIVDTWFK